jgi:two-component system, OmpR family, KDP operon response regulator KdpE
MTRPVILVVDDEAYTLKYLSMNLKARGYDVLTAAHGAAALDLFHANPVDLLILDIGMPGPTGFDVLTAVRRGSETPVIMLSARGRERDKVAALDLGADDYLTKPFGVEELMARVRAALRRAAPTAGSPPSIYRVHDLEIDLTARRVRRAASPVALTGKEFQILAFLARNAGKVMTPREILQAVWGIEHIEETQYVWTYMNRIRRKLADDSEQPRYILTAPGLGYSLPASP